MNSIEEENYKSLKKGSIKDLKFLPKIKEDTLKDI